MHFLISILIFVFLLRFIFRLIFGFGHRRHRFYRNGGGWGGGYNNGYGYGGPFSGGYGRPRGGGLFSILALAALDRILGRRW